MDTEFVLPKYEIIVKEDLSFNLLVYNWEVKSNQLLSDTGSSMKGTTLSALLHQLQSLILSVQGLISNRALPLHTIFLNCFHHLVAMLTPHRY